MRFILPLLSLLLVACNSSHGFLLSPYKMDIRQGNYLTEEMRAQIKLGMSRSQVRYVLGTPLIKDPFHADRWDYLFSLEQDKEIVETQKLTVRFSGDRLVEVFRDGKPVTDLPQM